MARSSTLWTTLAIIVAIAILNWPIPAKATTTAEVTEAQASVWKRALVWGTPIPACSIMWSLPPGETTEFHPELVDDFYWRPLCDGEVMVHCGNDTLAYSCWWPSNDEVDPASLIYMSITVDLEILLQVQEDTWLRGRRQFDGVGTSGGHRITVWRPDGEEITLFADDATHDADLLLEPGLYRIALHGTAATGVDAIEAYDGAVTASWESAATATRATTWSEIRLLYH